MNRLCTLALMALLFGCGPAADFDPQLVVRSNDAGVAIDGYSPVSYFQRGKPEMGSSDFVAEYGGLIYWLTDAEQVAMFTADPEKYAPAHGGWCSLMLTGSGQRTPANPETFKIVDGRLLLFWSGDYKGMAINGRRNWDGKFAASEEIELEALQKADGVWQRIITGRKNAKIVLFNEKDRERVAAHQLAEAKQQ